MLGTFASIPNISFIKYVDCAKDYFPLIKYFDNKLQLTGTNHKAKEICFMNFIIF